MICRIVTEGLRWFSFFFLVIFKKQHIIIIINRMILSFMSWCFCCSSHDSIFDHVLCTVKLQKSNLGQLWSVSFYFFVQPVTYQTFTVCRSACLDFVRKKKKKRFYRERFYLISIEYILTRETLTQALTVVIKLFPNNTICASRLSVICIF